MDLIFPVGPPNEVTYDSQPQTVVDFDSGNLPPSSNAAATPPDRAAQTSAENDALGFRLYGNKNVTVAITVDPDDEAEIDIGTPVPMLAWDAAKGTDEWYRNQGQDSVGTFEDDGSGNIRCTFNVEIQNPLQNVTRAYVPDISALGGAGENVAFDIVYTTYCKL